MPASMSEPVHDFLSESTYLDQVDTGEPSALKPGGQIFSRHIDERRK